MDPNAFFSPDYFTARSRFREAAARLQWELEAYAIADSQQRAEQLTVDVAVSPGDDSDLALVLSSGLHGVEGFFGSAVQLALLEKWKGCLPSNDRIRYVFLHALNPFGFTSLRRVDDQNVDLNRNFLLPGEEFAGAPSSYERLNGLLNPECKPSSLDLFPLRAGIEILRLGMPALRQAVAGGQYKFPKGLFFGGCGPSRLYHLLDQQLPNWLGKSRQVAHLDFHTGLGRSASHKLLLDYMPSERQRALLTKWFGTASFEDDRKSSIAYDVRGGLGRWCISRIPEREYVYVCVEFGTYGAIRVLSGLRAENQAHHWGQPTDRSTQLAKQRLKELFCPASVEWRDQVIQESIELVEKTVERLP